MGAALRASVRSILEADTLELTEENVELVLDDVRPYLMADGGNVEFVEIDGPVSCFFSWFSLLFFSVVFCWLLPSMLLGLLASVLAAP